MINANANQPKSVFVCGSLNKTNTDVISVRGKDEISQLYEFDIIFRSKKSDISSKELINNKATIFFYRNGEYFSYSGFIMEFRYLTTNVDYSSYQVKLVPSIYILNYNYRSRVFQKMSYPDIIKLIIKENNLIPNVQIDLQEFYETKEFIVQYKESDLNFIQRLMEEIGIFYLFSEDAVKDAESVGREKLVISDKPDSFTTIGGESSISYKSIVGAVSPTDEGFLEAVHKLSSNERIVPENVQVKNYNYRTPDIELSAVNNVPAGKLGKYYEYGQPALKIDEMEKHADLVTKRFTCEQISFEGFGNCAGFRAGRRFNLVEHEREDCDDLYLIQSVNHTFEFSGKIGDEAKLIYRNEFSLIPSDNIEIYKPQLRTKIPNVSGILTARIEGLKSPYASLDEMGRYKVRLPFDISDSKNYDASKYVRLAQPYSGPNYGIHFPSHEGAEMILACVDGNPNKVMGIGTIPNPETTSPVVSRNSKESVIRTAGDNEIIMDDTKGNEKISIKTPHDYFETAGNNQTISIKRNREKVVEKDEKNLIMNNRYITVDGKQTEKIKGNVRVNITEGDLKHDIETGNAKYHVKGKLDHQVEGKVKEKFSSSMETNVSNDIKVKSVNSSIEIEAAESIRLKTGQSSILLKNDGTIEIKGLKISINGNSIAIKGIESIKQKGGSITSNATVDHNIKGKIVLSEGSVTNTVKGAMVMLNP
jgi:type VI secretion system secreted protein VgrG